MRRNGQTISRRRPAALRLVEQPVLGRRWTVSRSRGAAAHHRRARQQDRLHRSTRLMVLAIGLTALTLSFGPTLPFYDWLYWLFPPLKMIRGVVRFGQIVLAAVAILAGFGLAWLTTRFRGRAVAVMAILLVIAANGEALRAPFGYTRYEGISKRTTCCAPQATIRSWSRSRSTRRHRSTSTRRSCLARRGSGSRS